MRTLKPVELTLDDSYITTTLELLKKAIQQVLLRNSVAGMSFNEPYYNAYILVFHKHGDKLYEMLKKTIEEHLRTKVRNFVVEAINGCFLATLNRVWTDHAFSMVIIRDILMYLDRVYIPYAKVETDWKNVCRMLIDLGGGNRDYYEQQFETRFLREASEFYRRTGQKFLAENNACVYVCKVKEFLKEEAQRSKERNLDGITEQKIIAV